VAQSVGHPTIDFISGHDLRVVGLSPASDSAGSLLGTLSLSLCPSTCWYACVHLCTRAHALSLSQINKIFKKINNSLTFIFVIFELIL